mgnify:CR=1 FL=1
MAYLDTRRRPSAASLAAVVAIHGAVGAALVLGLTVSGVIKPDASPIPTYELKKPPPPEPEPTAASTETARRDPYIPPIPFPLPSNGPEIDATKVFPTPTPPRPIPGPTALPDPLPSVIPSFAPIAAKPRNDPLRWVSTDDYKSNWIRQEMTGKARFRLEIAADGRVASCTITASSGHPELDAATCALVSRRAKFQPARGGEGQPVAGSYSNAIDWRLPD